MVVVLFIIPTHMYVSKSGEIYWEAAVMVKSGIGTSEIW